MLKSWINRRFPDWAPDWAWNFKNWLIGSPYRARTQVFRQVEGANYSADPKDWSGLPIHSDDVISIRLKFRDMPIQPHRDVKG